MNTAARATIGILLGVVAAAQPAGCDRKDETPSPSPTSATPAPTPAAKVPPEPPSVPVALPDEGSYPIQEGWVEIAEKVDPASRAWVEGSVEGGEKIVITTENVQRFQLDLARLRVDWSKRIVLRMDGFNSELTRKRWPVVDFVRTPAGSWAVVED